MRFELLPHLACALPDDTSTGIQGRDNNLYAYREWSPATRIEFSHYRRQILGLMDLRNLSELPDLFVASHDERFRLNQLIENQWVRSYAPFEALAHIPWHIEQAMTTANRVIGLITDKETGLFPALSTQASHLNEVEVINNPLDLLLLSSSPKASKRIRFESLRKLALADIGMQIMFSNGETNQQTDAVLRLFNTYIWSEPVGLLQERRCRSFHDPNDLACVRTETDGQPHLNSTDASSSDLLEASHTIMVRPVRESDLWAMIDHRQKDPPQTILKMLRKASIDPHEVNDMIGIKFVLSSRASILRFIDTFQSRIVSKGHGCRLLHVIDSTAENIDYVGSNPSSSPSLQVIKQHWLVDGILVEFQFYPLKAFLDSEFRHNISHGEYAVRRLFDNDTRALSWLYPEEIYGELFAGMQDMSIQRIREVNRRRLIEHN